MIEKLTQDTDSVAQQEDLTDKVNEMIDTINKLQEDVEWIGKIMDIKKHSWIQK